MPTHTTLLVGTQHTHRHNDCLKYKQKINVKIKPNNESAIRRT